jgi:hypothetical protein
MCKGICHANGRTQVVFVNRKLRRTFRTRGEEGRDEWRKCVRGATNVNSSPNIIMLM